MKKLYAQCTFYDRMGHSDTQRFLIDPSHITKLDEIMQDASISADDKQEKWEEYIGPFNITHAQSYTIRSLIWNYFVDADNDLIKTLHEFVEGKTDYMPVENEEMHGGIGRTEVGAIKGFAESAFENDAGEWPENED